MRIGVNDLSHRGHFRSMEREALSYDRVIRSSESGFTLFELMVTVAVSAILVGIAVPSYRGLIFSNRLTTATNDFIAAVNMAKLEAVRRNRAIQLCASSNNGSDTLGAGCSLNTGCGTAGGAPIPGTVCLLDGGTTPVPLYAAPTLPTGISLSSTSALRYGGQGLASRVGSTSPTYTGLLVDLSTTKLTTNNRRCVYITTGSTISSCSVTSTTGCPTSEPTPCQ